MSKRKPPPVVIIGAGPAGIACAIQLKRFGLDPLVIEQDRTGGLLHHAHWIENYPGFPGGVSGPGLVHLLRRHLKRAGVRVLHDRVRKIAFRKNQFTVTTGQRSIPCRTLVIASGTKPRVLPDSVVHPAIRNRILHDPSRLRIGRDKTVAIVGAGDAAFDYALRLAARHRIIILDRGSNPRCLPLLLDRARRIPRIRRLADFRIQAINPLAKTVRIQAQDGRSVRADYVIPALGRIPALDFLVSSMFTRIQALISKRRAWLIGDVHGGRFRQAGISVGEGIRCAMEIADLYPDNSR